MLSVTIVSVDLVLAPADSSRDAKLAEPPELVVGTKVRRPSCMKAEDGTWRGISIDLWRRIANQTPRRRQTLQRGLLKPVKQVAMTQSGGAK